MSEERSEHVKALITGGAGFIGSTIAAASLDAGIQPVVVDRLSTGRRELVLGEAFYEGDFADVDLVRRIFREHPDISRVVHCAADVVVPDSVADPLAYYDNNVAKTVTFLRALREQGMTRIVFSSSASIYRADDASGLDEDAPLAPGSPYAMTKAMVETVLRDAAHAGQLRAVALRYFNPIGADPKMRTGQPDPSASHVLARLIDAWSVGEPFSVTGTDWPTRDGTGLRDFIHVSDLASAHVAAMQRFDAVVTREHAFEVMNIGGGEGTTVRELVAAFGRVVGQDIEVRETGRRPGDVAGGYAIALRAERLLGWRAGHTLEEGIRDALEWRRRVDLGRSPLSGVGRLSGPTRSAPPEPSPPDR